MKFLVSIWLVLISSAINAEEFNPEKFAKDYFDAWTATQSPTATKENMREGMNYYLGAHTEFKGNLIGRTDGHGVVVIKYETASKGIHPQTKQEITQIFLTLEVLEIEKGKVSVIRKYGE